MPTIHYTKQQFIEAMSNLIEDDEHIIVTTEVDGSVEVKKKFKHIPFVFAADAFEKTDSVGDLLKSRLLALVIAPNSIVADKFKTKQEEEVKKKVEKNTPKCWTCNDSKQVEVRRIGFDSIMGRCPNC